MTYIRSFKKPRELTCSTKAGWRVRVTTKSGKKLIFHNVTCIELRRMMSHLGYRIIYALITSHIHDDKRHTIPSDRLKCIAYHPEHKKEKEFLEVG